MTLAATQVKCTKTLIVGANMAPEDIEWSEDDAPLVRYKRPVILGSILQLSTDGSDLTTKYTMQLTPNMHEWGELCNAADVRLVANGETCSMSGTIAEINDALNSIKLVRPRNDVVSGHLTDGTLTITINDLITSSIILPIKTLNEPHIKWGSTNTESDYLYEYKTQMTVGQSLNVGEHFQLSTTDADLTEVVKAEVVCCAWYGITDCHEYYNFVDHLGNVISTRQGHHSDNDTCRAIFLTGTIPEINAALRKFRIQYAKAFSTRVDLEMFVYVNDVLQVYDYTSSKNPGVYAYFKTRGWINQ